jgi:glycosyltransferase involved in cell wall biosynthesis
MSVSIILPVFNEEKYIAKTITSVINQNYSEIKLIISDNYSTDNSNKVIHSIADFDSRIEIIRPPQFLKSNEHHKFCHEFLRNDDSDFSMMLGGHDLISANYVEKLVQAHLLKPDTSVAYPFETYEIDGNGRKLRSWGGQPWTERIPKPYAVLYSLIALNHNTVFFGLVKNKYRAAIDWKHFCVGADHLYVLNLISKGELTPVTGVELQLRRVADYGNQDAYRKKNFDDGGDESERGVDDMNWQLAWLQAIQEECSTSIPEGEREVVALLTLTTWMLKYQNNLSCFPGAKKRFFSQQRIVEHFGNLLALKRRFDSYQNLGVSE